MKKNSGKVKIVSLNSIKELLKEASNAPEKKLADRYVYLARKIGMRHNIKIPSELQKKFCKHCYSYLRPGVNLRVRTGKKMVIYYCLECKKFMRFPIKKK